MKKRGQLLEQPFIYIFIVIVIGFVVIFGVLKIKDLNEVKEEATYLKFQTDLKDAVGRTYNKNEGTLLTFSKQSSNKPLLLPKDIKQVCFHDFITKTEVQLPNSNYQDFSIENLTPSNQDLCIQVINSQLSFKLENKIIEDHAAVVVSNV